MTSMTRRHDYISPGLVAPPDADDHFPDMIEGDPTLVPWRWMRKNDPHIWRCDKTMPAAGFINRDEATILYNTALKFCGRPALEIGCLFGWSAWHIAAAECKLIAIDPLMTQSGIASKVFWSLRGFSDSITYVGLPSPEALHRLGDRKWEFIFIDANHDAPHPLIDTVEARHYAAKDALILFHDVICPDVYEAVEFLCWRGWRARIYNTSQVMAACWRGDIEPVDHVPDPAIEELMLPDHLALPKFDVFSEHEDA